MLEDRPCLISRGYPRTCERENNWGCMSKNYRIEKLEAQQGKRSLENEDDEEIIQTRKLLKQSDAYDIVEAGLVLQDVSLSPEDQSGIQCSDNSDSMSNNYRIEKLEAQQGKRSLENEDDEEIIQTRKLLKQSDAHDIVEAGLVLQDVSLSPEDQSGNQRSDNSDSSSLIHSIGRDNTISCLIRCSRSDYGSIASLNRGFRDLIRSGELYRLRRLNDVIEHWVYFSCHLIDWEAFDPTRRRWMRLPTMTSNESFSFSDKESLAVGTELLVIGREFIYHAIYKYSLLTNTWSPGSKMNAPRYLFGSASLGEVAIVAGGCDPQGKILNSAELYSTVTGEWVTLPTMNKRRKMCSGVFMDKKFYVIGGVGGTGSDSKPLSCGEEYDLITGIWTEISNLSPVRTGAARENGVAPTTEAPPLVAVVDNELYAADCAEMEVRKYDKGKKAWETVGRLPERADSMNGWGIAFRGCGDRVIVIGGPRANGEGFIEVNSWVPREGPPRWNLLGRKQSHNFVYNCAVMGC